MRILESDFSNQIIEFVQNKLGSIFFFNHIAVVELNEGIHFDVNNAPLIIDELKSYFGETKPFGVVANRVNSYSVDLLSTPTYREKVSNLKAYGVVGHDLASKMNATMENDFCISEKVDYDTIYDAINYVYNRVKNSSLFSLN
ncbi:hypothetical protein [Jejuia pallidilutea]|uniref:Uncharacterized protein n=1 Tax=Jejuia pallidilutea TaxID=504487 RepID=A0A090VNS6_9FLAO|nr:hypothetical protein [Jejuia pallidilutea]GAL65673.1 hypothetical protein JCM19301_3358 [Jejuia pallidilutea]GAL72430.1 hypothetical protein JCM19302_1192 [Jejuia pallidilutea]GAL88653.1 hypothetical protein JCM19538_3166 [Jejuia pallidilutea]